MRITGAISLSRTAAKSMLWGSLLERVALPSPPSPQRVSVRHGTQRTSKTMNHDPTDYTRDFGARAPKSLYANPEDWVEEPQYPEIVQDLTTAAGIRYVRRLEGELIAKLPTVLDKQKHFYYLPTEKTVHWRFAQSDYFRRYWAPYKIPGYSQLYNILPLYQYLTRTAIVSDELPIDYYSYIDEATVNSIVDQIRLPVLDALLLEGKYFNKNYDVIPEEERTVVNPARNVIDALIRAVDVVCGRSYPHLHQLQMDTNTRCEAMWKRSGFKQEKEEEEKKKGAEDWSSPDPENEKLDKIRWRDPLYERKGPRGNLDPWTVYRYKLDQVEDDLPDESTFDLKSGEVRVQYIEDDNVYKIFRHENPLPEVVPRDSALSTENRELIEKFQVEHDTNPGLATYDPETYGFKIVDDGPRRYGRQLNKTCLPRWVPGFWFGDPCEFSTLSIDVPAAWDDVVKAMGEEVAQENLVANLIMCSFGRTLSQAMYLGFSFMNELTFPITTQSIMTNGRDWTFATYQTNSIALFQEDSDNPYQNLAWISKPVKLFEKIQQDQITGFNDDVLKYFVKMYLKSPVVFSDVNLRPHLAEPVKSYWKGENARVPFYHAEKRRDGKPRAPYKPEV